MLLLIFAMIGFFFLLVGAVAFVICTSIPPARRYALSVALWCACCGPCVVALMTLAGVALVTAAFVTKDGDLQRFQSPRLLAVFGWGYLIAGGFATAVVATIAAWLHQFVVRRFTFALFRLYATLVVAGIGSVFGWSLSWMMLSKEIPLAWVWSLLGMLLLVPGFGVVAYRGARGLRGDAPRKFAWVSEREFRGS